LNPNLWEMGNQSVHVKSDGEVQARFIEHLLGDIKALEIMLERSMFEQGIERIGAEQEFCLVSKDWRPSKNAAIVLEAINDPHFTTELAKYNLEINLDPLELKGDCFSIMESQLDRLLTKANNIAKPFDSKVVLSGILPTISQHHLRPDYLADRPRYHALNRQLMKMRGSHFYLHLMGVDELSIRHDSVLYEACNTSFQMHLQVTPDDFISSFNWAQAISGPMLAACTNSPLLLGRELWSETRIALFRQSIDTRHISLALKDQLPRVSFGSEWAKESIVDIYKTNISQYKIVLANQENEDSLATLNAGGIPKLKALALHNGTIYPWNRACYGVGHGKPHLRIENRYIPAGPSIVDEMANFALWIGLMKGRPSKYGDMASVMNFKDAKSNFIKSARYGKEAVHSWNDELFPARKLLLEVFLPIAENGLRKVQIPENTIAHYLGIIEKRINGKNGSQWTVCNYRDLQNTHKTDQSLRLLTRAMYKNQQKNIPVHEWERVTSEKKLDDLTLWVSNIMTTRLLTVKENDLADLATSIMEWQNVHHMPVEDEEGKLSGLLTWHHVTKNKNAGQNSKRLVKDIMTKKLITTTPDTPIKEAIQIMKRYDIGCLPIMTNSELIGIITVKDIKPYDHD